MADGSSWWRRTDSSTDNSRADGSRSRATASGEQNRNRESMRFQGQRRDAEQPVSTWGCTGQQQQHQQQEEGRSQLSKAAAAKLTVVLRSAVSPLELQHILESNYRQLCPQHVSAALNALGYMKRADRRSVEALLRQILLPALEKQLDNSGAAISSGAAAQQNHIWDSRSCAVALTALAALHAHHHVDALDLSHRLVGLFLRPDILQQSIPQGISMVASAAAKLRLRLDEPVLVQLLQGLQDAAARSLLQPMHVSQTLWGVATILAAKKHVQPQGHLRRLFLQVAMLMTDPHANLLAACKPVEICNTLAAFVIAELPLPTDSYAAALLDRFTAVGSLRTAVPQDLARTMWAAAKLDVEVPTAQCRAIVAAFCSNGVLDRAIAQDISNILWALGMMQQQDAITDHELCTLAAALLERAQQHRAAPQEISTTLWALATLQANLPRDLLTQLQEQFRQPHILAAIAEDEGQSLGLVNTLWATAALHKASLIGAGKSWRELQEKLQQKQQLTQRGGKNNSDGTNDVGDDEVASPSWAAVAALEPPRYEPILTAEAVQQLTDMLTSPGRVRHLTPCSVGLCLWATATLGGSLSYQQVELLVQRFLQPSCQALVLPLNFTNLVWGCIRLGRADVLQAPGTLDQLISAYFAAGAPGGPWAGKTDPLAASMLLWALAHVSAKPHKHRRLVGLSNWAKQRRRWEQEQLQEQQQEKAQQQQQQQQENQEETPDDWAKHLLLHPPVDDSSALQREDGAEPKQQQQQQQQPPNHQLHEAASPQKDKYSVSQRTVQRLFDVFLQRDSIAQADPAILSTALYAAALLQHPVTLDDLSWVLKAFVAKIEAAGAASLAHMLYAVTALQQSALLATGSSSNSNRGWVLASDRIDVAKANALVPVLVTLAQEFSWKLHYEATSADISDCVLGLARAVASGEEVPKSCGWSTKHRQQLQEALHGVLVQLHVADETLRKLSTDTLIDIVWACGEMGVVQEQLLEAVCQELFSDQLQSVPQPGSPPQQQQQHQRQDAQAAADAGVTLRPAYSKQPSQQQVGDGLSLKPLQQQEERPKNWWQQIGSDPHTSQAQPNLLHSLSSLKLQQHSPASGVRNGRAPLSVRRGDLGAGRRMGALECAQVAAALASTNMLTPELWKAVVEKFCNKFGPASASGALTFSDDGCEGSATVGVQMLSTGGVTADEGGGILQSIPLLCWAAAVADCRTCEGTVQQLCKLLAGSSSGVWRALRQEYLCQLFQVHLWLLDATAAAAAAATTAVGEAAEAPAGDEPTASAAKATPTQLEAASSKQGLASVLSSQQLAECQAAWYDATVDSSPSTTQVRIAAMLQHVPGLRDVKMEVLTSDGCFSIDVAGTVEDVSLLHRVAGAEGNSSNAPYISINTGDGRSVSLAVEVDGPQHFLYPTKQLNGESQYRSRALHVRGYAVVRLPWYEWQQVAGVRDSKEQHCVAYLVGKIVAVL